MKAFLEARTEDEAYETGRKLIEAVQDAPIYKGPVYRGMRLDEEHYRLAVLGAHQSGLWELNAPQSFSRRFGVARGFSTPNASKPFSVILHVAENRSGRMIEHVSSVGTGEAEVLGLPGTRYKVVRIIETKETTGRDEFIRAHIYLEET